MQDSLNLPSFGASTEMGMLSKEVNSRKNPVWMFPSYSYPLI